MSALINLSIKLLSMIQITSLIIISVGKKAVAPNTLGILRKETRMHLENSIGISTPLLIFLAFILILFNGLVSQANELHEHFVKQVVVQFASGTNQTEIDALIARYQMTIHEEIPQINYYVLQVSDSYTVEEIVASWLDIEIVETCEPNYISEIYSLPNDEFFSEQWGLYNNGSSGGLDNADLHMEEAWTVETGDPHVIVAIIDMGFDMSHEDLHENIWNNPGEIPNNGKDDDSNGYIDDIVGWDFVNQAQGLEGEEYDWKDEDNDPTAKRSSHGNAAFGLIAAATNNGLGVAGVAGKSKVMLLRTGYFKPDRTQVLNSVYIIKSLIYAADNGARVVNINAGSSNYSQSYKDALQYAIKKGAIIVCAAGNLGTNELVYPAAYDLAGLLSVGSSTKNDGLSKFSSYGSWVDVSAPGERLVTTLLDNRYGIVTGTSFSSPLVAGVAALIISKSSLLIPSEVKDIIMNTVDIKDGLTGANITSGRVNAFKALSNPPDDYWDSNSSETGDNSPYREGGDENTMGCFISTLK